MNIGLPELGAVPSPQNNQTVVKSTEEMNQELDALGNPSKGNGLAAAQQQMNQANAGSYNAQSSIGNIGQNGIVMPTDANQLVGGQAAAPQNVNVNPMPTGAMGLAGSFVSGGSKAMVAPMGLVGGGIG